MTTHGPDTCELCDKMRIVLTLLDPLTLATLRVSAGTIVVGLAPNSGDLERHNRSLLTLIDAELASRAPRSMSDLDLTLRQDQPCPDCQGDGVDVNWFPCPTCQGTGHAQEPPSCPYCGGAGEIDHGCAIGAKEPCPACRGLGYDDATTAALAAG